MQIEHNNAVFKRHAKISQSRAFDSSGEKLCVQVDKTFYMPLSKTLRSIDIESNDRFKSFLNHGRVNASLCHLECRK